MISDFYRHCQQHLHYVLHLRSLTSPDVQQIIDTDDVMKLLNHYEVPKDLRIEYNSAFVKRAMIVFDIHKNWNEDDPVAFVTLFKGVRKKIKWKCYGVHQILGAWKY